MIVTTVVTAPAESFDLTTLEVVKDVLNITTGNHDPFLTRSIRVNSGRVSRYCDRIFARQTYRDSWLAGVAQPVLQLAQAPVRDLVDFTIDDGSTALVLGTDFTIDLEAGILTPQTFGLGAAIGAIEYEAGWYLPPDARAIEPGGISFDIPDVEQAVVELVMADFHARGRDPMLRRWDQGSAGSKEFWVGGPPESGSLPALVEGMLSPFKRGVVA